MSVALTPLGTYATGVFDQGAAEINAYDPASRRLFVVNADATTVDILDLTDPVRPTLLGTIDASAFGGSANSVAVKNGVVAVAIEAETLTDPGQVVFFNAASGALLNQVTVGALPDMVVFTPDGSKVLVANEGEPADGINPEGSISIIDLAGGVTALTQAQVATADFRAFNGREADLRGDGVRLFPGVAAAQDFEPEYIAVSPDGTQAFVTLQEANAVAVVDLATARIAGIQALGLKDYSQGFGGSNGLDASDRDQAVNIRNWPVYGMLMPDAIATYAVDGITYYVTANEGDARSEDVRVKDIVLDPSVFPNAAELQKDANLGRLKVSSINGDLDGDGDYDQLWTYGGRSFSIFDQNGNRVFDSGDQIERTIAAQFPQLFNQDGGSVDGRSDDKGPEPEGVVIGQVGNRTYAFVGLERVGGVITYDITNPTAPTLASYQPGAVGDVGPEGLTFILAGSSPSGQPLLAVSNEVSGTTTLYQISPNPVSPPPMPNPTFTLELLHAADQEAGIPALADAPRFSAVLNALKAQDLGNDGKLDNTIVLSSGDAYIPGAFLNASTEAFGGLGRADILIQNELGFQAIAFGNHEFDFGTSTVASLIAASKDGTYPGTAFPYLSSNLDFSTDPNLAPLVSPEAKAPKGNAIAASTVIDVNGEKILVVGATTPTLKTISSPGGITLLPATFAGTPTPEQLDALATEIQADVDAGLAANPGINKVILLAHMQQIAIEQALAERLRNVDIIVAGGSNTRLFDESDCLRPGDTNQGVYPIVKTDADGKPVAVVNTDGNYKYVGRLVIDFDANGNIVPESYDASVSGAYATDEAGVAALNAAGLVDPEIVAITEALGDVIAAADGAIFGKSAVFLNGARSDVRSQETNFGNLSADANLAIARQIDPSVTLSLKNGGGIRDNIGVVTFPPGSTNPADVLKQPTEANPLANKQAGDISQLDIANSLRFNNGLSLITVTAKELEALIEHGVAASGKGATPGQFPQVGGMRFSFDETLPAGNRVQSLAVLNDAGDVLDTVIQKGELVGDPSRSFRMVTLGFLAGGGDGYPFPAGASANLVSITQPETAPRTGGARFSADGSEQDALAEYLLANFQAQAFAVEDVGPALDLRIQNLSFREDTVIPVGLGGSTGTDNDSGAGNGSGVEIPTLVNPITGSGDLFGSKGDEDFLASGDNVRIYAGEGQNRIVAEGRSTHAYGGSAADLIFLAKGNNVVYAGEGVNTVVTGEGDDLIYAGSGADRIFSGDGDDLIYAGEGENFIDAGGGNNTVYAGSGLDTFVLNGGGMTQAMTQVITYGMGDRIQTNGLEATSRVLGNDTLISVGGTALMMLKWFTGTVSFV